MVIKMENNKILCGLEIEFMSDNCASLIKETLDNNINIIVSSDSKFSNEKDIILKPEYSTRGFELNIPPETTYEQLLKICNIFSKYSYFSNKCSLHIHLGISNNITDKDLYDINDKYICKQTEIINEANEKCLYANLNNFNIENLITFTSKYNLNIFNSYKNHNTIEHRIYKGTFNYEDIVWCINQTKSILEE